MPITPFQYYDCINSLNWFYDTSLQGICTYNIQEYYNEKFYYLDMLFAGEQLNILEINCGFLYTLMMLKSCGTTFPCFSYTGIDTRENINYSSIINKTILSQNIKWFSQGEQIDLTEIKIIQQDSRNGLPDGEYNLIFINPNKEYDSTLIDLQNAKSRANLLWITKANHPAIEVAINNFSNELRKENSIEFVHAGEDLLMILGDKNETLL